MLGPSIGIGSGVAPGDITGVTAGTNLTGGGTTGTVTVNAPTATATTAGAVPTPPNNTTTFLRGDATFAAPSIKFPPFSDGSDGALDFDGAATVVGLVPSANVYTMVADIYPTNMTIRTGVRVRAKGFAILGTGNLLIEGTGKLDADGLPGSGSTAGAGTTNGSLGIGSPGGDGGGTSGSSGPNGGQVTPRTFVSTGGTAGAATVAGTAGVVGRGGGGGGGSAFSGGASGTITINTAASGDISSQRQGLTGRNTSGNTAFAAGTGGGGGGGDASSTGGGGGGGGGPMVIAFNGTITATANAISSKGGDGAAGTATNTGGGGGGGGGWVATHAASAAPTVAVTGGAGGASGGGTGAAGAAGGVGRVVHFDLRA